MRSTRLGILILITILILILFIFWIISLPGEEPGGQEGRMAGAELCPAKEESCRV